jgi:hypothetical protein
MWFSSCRKTEPGTMYVVRLENIGEQDSLNAWCPFQYFGSMAGVRGFNDPNVQVNADGKPVWYQSVFLRSISLFDLWQGMGILIVTEKVRRFEPVQQDRLPAPLLSQLSGWQLV